MQLAVSRLASAPIPVRRVVSLALGLAFVLLAQAALSDAGSPFPLSARRLAIVERETERVVGEIDFAVRPREEIQEQVAAAVVAADIDCRLRPTSDLITMEACREAAQQRAEREVARELPPPDDETVEREAAKLYPLLKEGDPIELFFMPNPARQLTVKGIFQGFDGHNIVVNRQRYPAESVRILNPPSDNPMLLIDAEQNADMRRQYKERVALDYRRQRSELMDRKSRLYMQRELVDAIKANEAAGFIYYKRHWHPLREVIAFELEKHHDAWLQAKQAKELEEKRKAEEEAARLAAEAAAAQPEMPWQAHPDMPPPPEGFHGDFIPPAEVRQPPTHGGGFTPPFPPPQMQEQTPQQMPPNMPPNVPQPPVAPDEPPAFRPAMPPEE